MDSVYIERATEAHARALAHLMRPEDEAECEAVGLSALAMILKSLGASEIAYAVFFGGELGCIVGVAPYDGDTALGASGCGTVWMLSGGAVARHKRAFLRTSKTVLAGLLERYGYLENVVDSRYAAAIRWAKWLGFVVREPRRYSFSETPFCHIHIRRESWAEQH